jgi:hypothetical protein
MKTKICLLGFFALVSLAIAAPHTWIFTTGKTVTGDYFSSGITTLVLKTGGTNCFIKLSDLSADDQTYVAAMKASVANGRTVKPIDGLAGIKLGQPLPPDCTNSQSFSSGPDEWGFQTIYRIVPPQTNSEFKSDGYQVTLTPTNRLVCAIQADGDKSDYDTMLIALRRIYGTENNSSTSHYDYSNIGLGSGYQRLSTWSQNYRTLELYNDTHGSGARFNIICEDQSLEWHPPHVPDTKGL